MAKSKMGQREALEIAKKIGANLNPDGKHQTATLWHKGKLILRFGIRHSKKSGQGHLVGENHELRLNATRALALAKCTMSKEEYIEHLKGRGLILD